MTGMWRWCTNAICIFRSVSWRSRRGTPLHIRSVTKLPVLALIAATVGTLSAYGFAGQIPVDKQRSQGWPVYGGQAAQDHYSSLSQINQRNVRRLKVAWTLDLGEEGSRVGSLQTNPLILGRVLYALTPSLKVIAVDAVPGKLLWKFDSGVKSGQPSRGLTYWSDGKESRLFAGVMNFLYALDPATGKPIEGFGENGRIDLRKGLRGDYRLQSIALTSPGIIYKDMIIVGGRNPETRPAPPGDIRAFDVRTGVLRWRFDTIPHPGEPGYDTWPKDAWKSAGAANNWTGMSLDLERGIVYIPTGSAVSDYYGADRVGDNLFADSLLALDAETGKLIWYFQGVHHDIWDRDFPSPPVLVTVRHDGKSIDAVARPTKQGWLFLFDRTNGKPLFPIEEKKFPASTVPGEIASPTQPVPLQPEPYARQWLTEELLTRRTPEAHAWAVQQFRTFHGGGPFIPLELGKQTVVFPERDGGAEWGGSAADPQRGVIYINANDIAETGGLVRNDPAAGLGLRTYRSQCAVCHGEDRTGSPPAYPSLLDVYQRYTAEQIADIIHLGRGRMSSFPALSGDRRNALLEYLRTGKDDKAPKPASATPAINAEENIPYASPAFRKFYDPDGYPAIAPPWGTLNAIDLNTGKYLWKRPLGEYPQLAAKDMKNTGTENYGGPVATAGGIVIIAATSFDRTIRAFHTRNGKLLWQAKLPYDGVATPATYMVDGKQYVAIGTCGARDPKGPQGAAYVAFALP
jgi:quinoprotein glucose dehydrogenase